MCNQSYPAEVWTPRSCHRNMVLPFEYGLMVYIDDEWKRLAWIYLNNALSTDPNPIGSTRTDSEFLRRMRNDGAFTDEGGDNRFLVYSLFSADGAGKTHHLSQLLQKHWGSYMVAPNLQPHGEELNTTGFVEPQRYWMSRDTLTMFQDHPEIESQWLREGSLFPLPIIVARCALLYEFLHRYPEQTPGTWLSLQISCQISHPFDTLYSSNKLARKTTVASIG